MTQHTYDFWHRALAGEKIGGPDLPIHEDAPQPGFYRRRFAGERRGMGEGVAPLTPFIPIAIFEQDGALVALIEERYEDPVKHWLSCCRHPVSEEAYRAALETGQWPDVDAAIKPAAPPAPQTTIAPPPQGHNAPEDPADELRDQIESAKAGLSQYAKIESDETAKKAQSLRSRLLELVREVAKAHKVEKEPHLESGRAVDRRYKPLEKDAQDAAKQIAEAIGAWEDEKAQRAAKARREAEEAARKAEEAGKPAPPPSPPPEPLPTQVKGGYGRAASIKVVNVVTAVTDWDALWGFLRTHPELIALMEKLAQRAVDKGHEVPGIAVEEKRKVA
jgi:hypothetical protein